MGGGGGGCKNGRVKMQCLCSVCGWDHRICLRKVSVYQQRFDCITYRGRCDELFVSFVPLVDLHQILMLFVKVL